MKNLLLPFAFLAALFANTSHAGITLTIEDFVAAAPVSSSDSEKSKGVKVNSARTKSDSLTKSRNAPSPSAQNAVLELISSSFEAASGSSAGSRSSGPTSGGTYLVSRTMDNHSSAIAEAAQTGKIFSAAVIANSSSAYIRLDNIYLSSYATSMSGGASVETFRVHFQTQTVN